LGNEPFRLREWLFQLAANKPLLLMVGGSAGTCARYYLGRWIGSQSWGQEFPVGTLLINVAGSFVLGFVFVTIRDHLPPEYQDLNLLIGVGFCGGFTTFSTFELETLNLIRDGSWLLALANVLASVVVGFIAVFLGASLARALFLGGSP
jgi:CrcB protein